MSVIFRIVPTGQLDGVTVPTITRAVQDAEGIYNVEYTSAGGNIGVLNLQELMLVAQGNTQDDHLVAQIILTDGPATTVLEVSQLAYNAPTAGPNSGVARKLLWEYLSAAPTDTIGPKPFLNYTGQRLMLESDNGASGEAEIYVVVIPVSSSNLLDAICCTQGEEEPEPLEPCIEARPMEFASDVLTATTTTRYLNPTGAWGSGTASVDEIGITLQAATILKRLELVIENGAGNGEDIVYTVNLDGAPTGLTLTIPSTSSGAFSIDLDVTATEGQVLTVEAAKALAVGSSPSGIQANVRYEGCAAAGASGGDFAPLFHYFYVAKNGSDVTGTGSIAAPFLTVQAAYDAIGNAADNTEWNDADNRYYIVDVAPGVYDDGGMILPVRPSVWTYLDGASLVGDVFLAFPNALITSGIGSPQWGFRGNGRRSVWDDSGFHTINGIDGDVQMDWGTGQASSFFPQMHFFACGLTGDFQCAGTFSGAQLYMHDTVIGGHIQNAGPGQSLSVWADGVNNEDAGDISGIGGVDGLVNLLKLTNVLVKSAEPTGSVDGWRWYNVRLLDVGSGGGPFDFSGSTATVQMDEASYEEYVQAVDIFGGDGFAQAQIDIDAGDPWKQVRSSAGQIVAAGPAVLVVGMAITNLLPGDYDFGFGCEAQLGGDPALAQFELRKNGVGVADTLRSIGHTDTGAMLGSQGEVHIGTIETSIPTDLWEVWVTNVAPGTLNVAERVFKAIRVGSQIPEVGP